MKMEVVRTGDKGVVLALLERCLASTQPLCVQMQNLDGVYAIEVLRVTNEAMPDNTEATVSS